jgi:hypothetical protein
MYFTQIKRLKNNSETNRAQYAVVACWPDFNFSVFGDNSKVMIDLFGNPKIIAIKTNKPYRSGNLINPRRALGIPKKAS